MEVVILQLIQSTHGKVIKRKYYLNRYKNNLHLSHRPYNQENSASSRDFDPSYDYKSIVDMLVDTKQLEVPIFTAQLFTANGKEIQLKHLSRCNTTTIPASS